MGPLLFFAGAALRAAFILAPSFTKADLKKLLLVATGMLVVYAQGLLEGWSSTEKAGEFYLACVLIGILVSLIVFYKRLLPAVHEGTLLLLGVVTSYLFATYHTESVWSVLGSTLVYCVTGIALLLSFTRTTPSAHAQVSLYVSFLIVSLLSIVPFFKTTLLPTIACDACSVPLTLYVPILLFGYMFYSVISLSAQLLLLAPIPLSKHQNFRQRFTELKAYMQVLEQQYLDSHLALSTTILILLIASFLLFNYFFLILTPELAASSAFALGSIILSVTGRTASVKTHLSPKP
jgi:hypothetical protein